MWLQRLTSYLLEHRFRALLWVFFGTFVPVIGVFGIVIAGLVTLCKGAYQGILLTLAATLPYVMSVYFSGDLQAGQPLFLWVAVAVAVISNLLTWVFAVMLRGHMSWSQILQVAALLGGLVVSVFHLLNPNVTDWWALQLSTYFTEVHNMTGALKSQAALSDGQAQVIDNVKYYATGLIAVAVLLNSVLQVVMARWWQTIIFYPGKLRRELYSIRLSYLASILFVAGVLLSYWGNIVVLDIMPVLYALFAVAGLSLLHALFYQGKRQGWFVMILLYLGLIWLFPLSVILISAVAFLDSWFDFRKRLRNV